jgi:hypothetical protein
MAPEKEESIRREEALSSNASNSDVDGSNGRRRSTSTSSSEVADMNDDINSCDSSAMSDVPNDGQLRGEVAAGAPSSSSMTINDHHDHDQSSRRDEDTMMYIVRNQDTGEVFDIRELERVKNHPVMDSYTMFPTHFEPKMLTSKTSRDNESHDEDEDDDGDENQEDENDDVMSIESIYRCIYVYTSASS